MYLFEREILNIITLIVLVFIILQDFKARSVHLFLLIALFSLGIITNYLLFGYVDYLSLLQIILFVLLNVIILVLYYSIKKKEYVNPINKSIGLGDIIFFLALSPFFFLKEYVLFFILGLLFSIFFHLLVRYFNYEKNITIPLAGYLAFFFILIAIVNILGFKFLLNGW